MVLAAARQNDDALQYASHELKTDPFVLQACKDQHDPETDRKMGLDLYQTDYSNNLGVLFELKYDRNDLSWVKTNDLLDLVLDLFDKHESKFGKMVVWITFDVYLATAPSSSWRYISVKPAIAFKRENVNDIVKLITDGFRTVVCNGNATFAFADALDERSRSRSPSKKRRCVR